MAFLNATPDAPGQPAPSFWDADAVEAAQFASEFTGGFPIIAFVNAARPWIEMSAGGNASWTKGENFALLLAHSPYAFTVARLYHEAGLNLFADLASLNVGANIPADPAAIASLQQTSVPTGNLQVPELDMHTIHDRTNEMEHIRSVPSAGGRSPGRRASTAAAHSAPRNRRGRRGNQPPRRPDVGTGRNAELEDFANSLALDAAAFVRFKPLTLSGDNGPFDPRTNS